MKIRVVFDTNIYISAAITPSGRLNLWLDIAASSESALDLYVSEEILAEVREKLVEKFGLAESKVDGFLTDTRSIATIVEPAERVRVIASDPDDNMVVECALAARANLVVSADPDVYSIVEYRGIGFCHPRELPNIFRQDMEKHSP